MIREKNQIQQTSAAAQQHEIVNIPVSRNVFLDRFFSSFHWKEFACGCGAAFVNIGITYPIYKMIFRQMLHDVPITSAFSQLRHEGLMFLYRGMFPPSHKRPYHCPLCLVFLMGPGVIWWMTTV